MMDFSWLDIVITCIVVISMLTGLFRGLVKESISLAVWVVALWLAFHYSSDVAVFLQNYIHEKTIRTVAAFILILIGVILFGAIVNICLGLLLRSSGLSSIDRILGMAFGFARGVFIVVLVGVVFKIADIAITPYTKQSQLYPKLSPMITWMSQFAPHLPTNIVDFP